MKKSSRLVLALLIVPFLVPLVEAGTAYVGTLTQAVNNTQIKGVSLDTGSGASGTGTQRVILASDSPAGLVNGSTVAVVGLNGSPIPVSLSASTIAVVGLAGAPIGVSMKANGVPLTTRIAATASSAQLLAANANRIGLECDTDCNNTDRLHIRWGGVAATTSDKRVEVCGSWQPPAVSTVALQVITNSGTQNITCVEYSSQ